MRKKEEDEKRIKQNEYYNKTKNGEPSKNLQYLISKEKIKHGKAIDLGCGMGNDTIFLLKNNWEVISIDKENVEKDILERLDDEEIKRFKFERQKFEKIKLEKCNLIVANKSLSFCYKNCFDELWNKIIDSILPGGYFVGNFFGDKDDWKDTMKDKTFLSEEEVRNLFEYFEKSKIKASEIDGITAKGDKHHWHIINVIAKK